MICLLLLSSDYLMPHRWVSVVLAISPSLTQPDPQHTEETCLCWFHDSWVKWVKSLFWLFFFKLINCNRKLVQPLSVLRFQFYKLRSQARFDFTKSEKLLNSLQKQGMTSKKRIKEVNCTPPDTNFIHYQKKQCKCQWVYLFWKAWMELSWAPSWLASFSSLFKLFITSSLLSLNELHNAPRVSDSLCLQPTHLWTSSKAMVRPTACPLQDVFTGGRLEPSEPGRPASPSRLRCALLILPSKPTASASSLAISVAATPMPQCSSSALELSQLPLPSTASCRWRTTSRIAWCFFRKVPSSVKHSLRRSRRRWHWSSGCRQSAFQPPSCCWASGVERWSRRDSLSWTSVLREPYALSCVSCSYKKYIYLNQSI